MNPDNNAALSTSSIKLSKLLPAASISLELYRLAAIFLASVKFAEIRGPSEDVDHPINKLQIFEADEIKRILLIVAVAVRVLDDHHERLADLFVYPCGKFTENGKAKELTIREACNKIIHADEIEIPTCTSDNGNQFLSGIVILHGRSLNPRKVWIGHMNVQDFVRETSQYITLMQ